MDQAETYDDLMRSIRGQMELEKSIDLPLNDLVGIRIHNKGPRLSPRSWSKLNKTLERVEVVLKRSTLGKKLDRQKIRQTVLVLLVSLLALILCFITIANFHQSRESGSSLEADLCVVAGTLSIFVTTDSAVYLLVTYLYMFKEITSPGDIDPADPDKQRL